MQVEIVELRDFPSGELNRAGHMETHAFVRVDGGEILALNLHRQVTDPSTIKLEVSKLLQQRQQAKGLKFSL